MNKPQSPHEGSVKVPINNRINVKGLQRSSVVGQRRKMEPAQAPFSTVGV